MESEFDTEVYQGKKPVRVRKSKAERKKARKDRTIRIICIVLALSMVISVLYGLYIYLVEALS